MAPRHTLYVDIETYSGTDLKKCGAYRYVQDPDFQILMAAWALDDDPVSVAVGAQEIDEIPGLYDPDVEKIAHNSAFERVCFSAHRGLPPGEYLPAEQWTDTMALAAEGAWPNKLEFLAQALGLEGKAQTGPRLIRLFTMPNRQGVRTMPSEKPEDWELFKRYCAQDVVVLRECDRLLMGFPTTMERSIFLADQAINDRGLRVDTGLARRARRVALANAMMYEIEFTRLTGVANPNSVPQMKRWLAEPEQASLAELLPDLRADTVEKALEKDLEPRHRRVLELRQELALAAPAKFGSAIVSTGVDGRLRGTFHFHGAHTGRWAGRGVQPHNLPRAQFESDVDQELAITDLENGEQLSQEELKKLVRSLFLGPLSVVDYSSIEARVISWWCGEDWALKAFRRNEDIYVATAKAMGGLTRSQGKVAVLALGFGGGPASLRVMARDTDMYKGKPIKRMDDESLYAGMVNPWRRANPNIVRGWAELESAFREGDQRVGPHIYVAKDGKDRAIRLPSGRNLYYHSVTTAGRITFKDFSKAGRRVDTYGGRLAENVTQAIARDLLGEALVRLEADGYPVVGHVHDEILVEDTNVDAIREAMIQNPRWARGLPIDAAGFTCDRYRKER